MESSVPSAVDLYITRIGQFIANKNYKRIVLQLPKQLLIISFDLISSLKKQHANRQFFVLYDSLKQACCIDTLGAQHANYDCLIHFGRACFSSPHLPHHYYIFTNGEEARVKQIINLLNSSQICKIISENNVGYLLVDQPYYQIVKKQVNLQKLDIELLKLAYDAQQQDQYLIFGYYSSHINKQLKNILIVSDINNEETTSQMGFVEKVGFTLKSLHKQIGQKVYTLGQDESEPIIEQKLNNMKRLMQRYSIISKLQQHNTFGVLVSNTGTSFVNQIVERCKQILKKHNKKCFLFMMNNLNQVKLGNFSEIEVYVVVSCYNNSLFSVKDFHKLVVTPTDLEIAFQNRNFDQYGFDLKSQVNLQQPIKIQLKAQQQEIESNELQKLPNQQLVLQNKIQTLDYYRQRQYKGLSFSEKKQIKKMTKGKIGLAQQYTNLE